ncbi:hypothetical protein ACIGAN_03740 [Streptomyces sp. NPDC085931]|uniref:hypothetical protein n=1 Tax=Streptomyces sp. NPDC085931 TaxID=3365740 RepID=UPI0037D1C4BF
MSRFENAEKPSGSAQLYTEPFDVALKSAIQRRGLSLERLRHHLARRGVRIGLSSLSNRVVTAGAVLSGPARGRS